jgi:hypothetical protein
MITGLGLVSDSPRIGLYLVILSETVPLGNAELSV